MCRSHGPRDARYRGPASGPVLVLSPCHGGGRGRASGAQHPRYRRALKDVAARGHTAQSAGHTSSAQLRPPWLSKRSRLLVKDLLSQSVRQVAVPQGDQEGYEPAGWRAATAWASRGARPWAPWGHGFSRGPGHQELSCVVFKMPSSDSVKLLESRERTAVHVSPRAPRPLLTAQPGASGVSEGSS